MINNRQAGRRRGRGNNNGGGGGGGQRQGNPGRDNGNRIDSRARGNAAQLHEKYKNLARDAQLSGDRVNIEYYLQFADHYFRVLSEQRSRSDEAQPPRRQQQDWFDADNDGDDEYGVEGEPIRASEQDMQGQPQRDGNRNDGNRNDGNRGDGQRDSGQRNDGQREQAQREGGQRDQQRDGNRNDANRNDGSQRGARTWNQDGDRRPQGRDGQEQGERRPRADREARGEQPRNEQRGEQRQDVVQPVRVETVTADAPIETPMTQDFVVPEAEAPRRRGRPRRDAAPLPVAAADESDATFGADRLPPSLGLSAVASNDTDPPKPRRRRTPRVATDEAAAE